MTIAKGLFLGCALGGLLLAGSSPAGASAADGTGIVLVVEDAEDLSPALPTASPTPSAASLPPLTSERTLPVSQAEATTALTEERTSIASEEARRDEAGPRWRQLPGEVHRAGEVFAVPLGLAAAVAAFLAVERRFDGRDAKLTRSPLNTQLRFE